MVAWQRKAPCLHVVLVMLLTLLVGAREPSAQQQELVNGGTVGLIIDSAESSDVELASDLVAALNDGYKMRVLPVLGQGSVRNVEDLLYLRGIDVALVQADVLDFYRGIGTLPEIGERIRYIAKLANEEVHVLARQEVASVQDLDGRRVNFGVEGSGSFLTAGILLDRLGIDVNVTSFPLPKALKEIEEGTIDALIVVGAAPIGRLRQLDHDNGLHLLPIPDAGLGDSYQPAEIAAGDYPDLLEPGTVVKTVAVAKILTAFNWPEGHPRGDKVKRFVDSLFANIDRLARPPFHPKWREVDLLASLPGWERLSVAETLVAEHR
ncbi:MAG: TAXI family TRAP transporter solute-binding subunit [Alphaproteobacteria bacterium]